MSDTKKDGNLDVSQPQADLDESNTAGADIDYKIGVPEAEGKEEDTLIEE